MNENKEIKRTSKSHLKALVKKGREQAQKEKEADDRDRAERAIRRKTRQGSNYDPSEDDLEDSYTPEGETTLSELKKSTLQSYVRKVSYKNPETGRGAVKPGRGKGYTKAQARLTAKNAQELGYDGPNIRRLASKVQDSYSPEGETTLSEFDSSTTEFADRVINRVYEGFDKMTAGELEDYDNNANKPKHGRKASQQERKKMAAKFQNSRGGASTKTKQGRDLRLRKAK